MIQIDFIPIEVKALLKFDLIHFILNIHFGLGSLTTPPCAEAVRWVLFPDTLPVTNSQMFKFRQLSNGIEGSVLVDNFRALQLLGTRRIFVRKVNARNTKITNKSNDENEVNFDDLDWLD